MEKFCLRINFLVIYHVEVIFPYKTVIPEILMFFIRSFPDLLEGTIIRFIRNQIVGEI